MLENKLIRKHVIKHNNDWIVSTVKTLWCRERDYDKKAKTIPELGGKG